MSLTEAAGLQLTQLAATQRHRAKLPEASSSESQSLGSRKANARTRKDLAVEVSRARVEALLTGVSAPLLALAGQRASLQLTPDQRLALENYLLNLEEAELKRQVSALEAEAEALIARERAAKAALEAIPSELQRLQQQAAEVKVCVLIFLPALSFYLIYWADILQPYNVSVLITPHPPYLPTPITTTTTTSLRTARRYWPVRP